MSDNKKPIKQQPTKSARVEVPKEIFGQFVLPPDAERTIEGFRDTGYDFNTAVADLVDNSVAAKATKIQIIFNLSDEGEIQFALLDNGTGMKHASLWNAMQYGSSVVGQQSALSKFGMGLKTASTSQARKLVVTSRADKKSPLISATWDLDLVAASNQWLIDFYEPDDVSSELFDLAAPEGHGTVLEWRKVDRILLAQKQFTQKRRLNAFKKMEQSLSVHLGTVFQRFIDPSIAQSQTVEITVNGSQVEPWDPFGISHGTFVRSFKLSVDGLDSIVDVKSYVLPREEQVDGEINYKLEFRPANDNQGVYVYRENRLIAGPDWLGLVKKEPHANLARMELNFDRSWDDLFGVDVKKSEIKIQDFIRDELISEMNYVRNLADERRRKGQKRANAVDMHQGAAKVIAGKAKDLSGATVTDAIPGKASAGVVNTFGPQQLKVRVLAPTSAANTKISIAPNGLDDGKLWEPTVTANIESGVTDVSIAISATHPFYRKVYSPQRGNPPAIQALDFLLWALANAELNYTNDQNRKTLEDFRFEISRNLRTLVEDLPEPLEIEGELTQILDPDFE